MVSSQKILKIVLLAGLALVMLIPIYVDSDFFFPYIFSKALAFRLSIEVLFLVWLFKLVLQKGSSIKINWLTVIFGVYLVIMFVASLLGGNFYFSFWSYIERSEGLLLWLHLFALVVLLTNVPETKKDWHWLMEAFFFGAQVVAVLAFLQYIGVDFVNKSGGDDRVASTIGNAAFFAGYLILALFTGLYLSLQRRLAFKYYYWLAGLLDIFIILQTGTRGAFLALLASLAVFLFYNFFRLRSARVKISLAALAIVLFGLGLFVYTNKSQPWVQQNLALMRVTSISLSEKTAQDRFRTWNSAWQGFLERPLLGYGQENFYVVFNKYFNPDIYAHANSRLWFDRAHNIFIDHLITGGLIGLVLYIWLLFYPLWLLFKHRGDDQESGRFKILGRVRNFFQRQQANFWDKESLASQLMFLVILAFIVQGVVLFESLAVYIGLFLLLSFIAVNYGKASWQLNAWFIRIIFIIYILALTPIVYLVNIREAQANLILIEAIRYQSANPPGAYSQFLKAIELNTSGTQEYRRRLAEFVASQIVNKTITPQLAATWVSRVDQELEQRMIENPQDVANLLLYMRHRNTFYILDPNRLVKVEELGNLALKLSPTRPQIYYEMGYAEYYLGDAAKAANQPEQASQHFAKMVVYFDKAIDLNPKVVESYVNVIMVLLAANQGDKVQPYFDLMDQRGVNYLREDSLYRMMNSAVSAKDFVWVAKLTEELIKINPNNPQ